MKQKTEDHTPQAENAESRKRDHIELAFQSRQERKEIDGRFNFEPLLTAHPKQISEAELFDFAGKKMRVPVWVSSMTGGTALAEVINRNLCKACAEFGMGFGLGSCRSLLEGNVNRLKDFEFRDEIGDELPFYANLGIAQLEEVDNRGNWNKVVDLVGMLKADGLIIHVNPLQEALQPEGDRFSIAPLDTISTFLEKTDLRIIVKEVGQGFGPRSLKALLQLPLQAIEFGAHGGTNFAKLELLRSDPYKMAVFAPLSAVGHTAEEMCEMANQIKEELMEDCAVEEVIISGGVENYLDGYYYLNKSNFKAVYGQASGFLKHATGDYEQLRRHVRSQLEGYYLAKAFLQTK